MFVIKKCIISLLCLKLRNYNDVSRLNRFILYFHSFKITDFTSSPICLSYVQCSTTHLGTDFNQIKYMVIYWPYLGQNFYLLIFIQIIIFCLCYDIFKRKKTTNNYYSETIITKMLNKYSTVRLFVHSFPLSSPQCSLWFWYIKVTQTFWSDITMQLGQVRLNKTN